MNQTAIGFGAVAVAAVLGMVALLAFGGGGAAATNSGGSGVLNAAAVPAEYVAAVTEAGTHCEGISSPLIAAQIEAESNWNPKATSSAGAQGLAQFMPGTWASWGKDYDGDGIADPFNGIDAIGSQADYMCHLLGWVDGQLTAGTISGDRLQLALAAYNAGAGNVQKAGGIPAFEETKTYVERILGLIPKYTATGGGPVDAGGGPPVSADGTYRQPQDGSGRLDPSTLCHIPWAPSSMVLRCDAEAALEQLNAAYHAQFGVDLAISSAYRDYATQVRTKAEKGYLAAAPGTSNHGWGLAVDFGNIGDEGSPTHNWLRANAPAYGWNHPSWARRGGSKKESWHWEFVGN